MTLIKNQMIINQFQIDKEWIKAIAGLDIDK